MGKPKLTTLCQRIVDAAETADNIAIHADGPVSATHEVMSREEIIRFFRDSYQVAKRILEGEEEPV